MFWKKAPAQGDAASMQPGRPTEKDALLDTVVELLKVFGERAFDIDTASREQTQAQCQALIDRLVLGPRGDDKGPLERTRDLPEVRRYITLQRENEQKYVTRSIGNLRQALFSFAHCLTHAFQEDRAETSQVSEQLMRLVKASENPDSELIRREVESTVEILQSVLTQRDERQKALLAELGSKVQELSAELAQARERAALDPLTQLYNRASLDAHLDRVADLAFLLSSNPCLLMVDVDHFKSINDKFGHIVGDQVLRRVSDTLVRHFMRREDFVARYGGEEFVIVIPDSTLQNAVSRGERVRKSISELDIEHEGFKLRVTVSVGIATLNAGDNGRSWLARADAALYQAKGAGRDRVQVAVGEKVTALSSPVVELEMPRSSRQR